MSTVRAKFHCYNKEESESGHVVKLRPVISGSEENDRFYKYTPGGDISLSTINGEAAKRFEVGKEYYVDFTPA